MCFWPACRWMLLVLLLAAPVWGAVIWDGSTGTTRLPLLRWHDEPDDPLAKAALHAKQEQERLHTNSIGMEFILIPAGTFMMGAPPDEPGRWKDEGPVHKVRISQPFYLGKYEVTQGEWQEVMGKNWTAFKGNDRPVMQVSWNEVQAFIQKLNAKEGGRKYRLPTAAEWEYAARAGTTTAHSFGDNPEPNLAIISVTYMRNEVDLMRSRPARKAVTAYETKPSVPASVPFGYGIPPLSRAD